MFIMVIYNKISKYKYKSLKNKSQKYIPFLQRKLKCFPRYLETFKAVFKVFLLH